jgi:hypothetical protein
MRVPSLAEVTQFARKLTRNPTEVYLIPWGGEWHLVTHFRRPGACWLGVYDYNVRASDLRDDMLAELAQRSA